MGINFAESPIYGTHGPVIAAPPELQAIRAKFTGVKGISQVIGESGARMIYTEIWIHNSFAASTDLIAYLQTLDRLVGTHGVLEITGAVPAEYPECTFEGFERDPRGPLPDIAGTLTGAGKWWIAGTLRWTQLSVWVDPPEDP